MPPGVAIRPSPAITSVPAPTTRFGLTPSITYGLPALPMPAMRPSLIPMSALTIPNIGSITMTLVITRSRAPWSLRKPGVWPMPSRIVLPPPKTISSPWVSRSRSTSQISEVSASRKRSPAVGPYRAA